MSSPVIKISQPAFLGIEANLVEACLEDPPNLSMGGYTRDFEETFADWIGVKHAVACSSGTTALQLAFRVLADATRARIGTGYRPRVFVPNLTYIATANSITQWRNFRDIPARLVLIDADYGTWNMEPGLLAGACPEEGDIIVPVHLYGNPCAMDEILDIANGCGALVLEDACQAHGATYKGRKVGGLGDAGVFSFFGNKILTTGEGGMITTDSDHVAEQCRYLRGQAVGPGRYEHNEIGFNFRITELQSAIGIGQVMLADNHIEARNDIREIYRKRLRFADLDFQREEKGAKSVPWIETIRLPQKYDVRRIAKRLMKAGIETRPSFPPISTQRPYLDIDRVGGEKAHLLHEQLLSLPMHASLTEVDVNHICSSLASAMTRSCQ